MDKGYTDFAVLVEGRGKYSDAIVGPVTEDPCWQACEGYGFDKSRFMVDWDQQVMTCPAGKQSLSWLPNTYPKNGMESEVWFSRKGCMPRPFLSRCTKAKIKPRLIS